MIRIFIAVLLYLIGLFTQAQEPSEQKAEQMVEVSITADNMLSHNQDYKNAAYGYLYVSPENFGHETNFRADKTEAKKDDTAVAFDPIYMPPEAWKSNHN